MSDKVKGVYWHKIAKKWQSRIVVNGKNEHLGLFNTYEEAVAARKEAEIKYGYIPLTTPLNLNHKDDLTQEMLKELLHYNPETGDFTWKVSNSNRIKIGDVAGTINNKGYIRIKIDNKMYLAHRIAFLYMTGKFPEKGLDVDHINHHRSDNKWTNLRIATRQGNMRNQNIRENNTSGCVGVHWDNANNKWRAQIGNNGKQEYLGSFKNKEEAIAARKAAEIKYNYHENHGKQNNQLITEED